MSSHMSKNTPTYAGIKGTYTVAEVAARYAVHDRTVRRWVKEGKLPAHRFGGKHLRFTDKDLEMFDQASVVTV